MKKEILTATALLLTATFLLYAGNFYDQGPEVKTVNNFSEDTMIQSFTVHEGEPVYTTFSNYSYRPYYDGKLYGENFELSRHPELRKDKLVSTTENNSRNLLMVNGEVKINSSENLIAYDILNGSPIYGKGEENITLKHGEEVIRDFNDIESVKVIDGKIAVMASKEFDDYIWYNGSVIEKDVSSTELKEYRGKPTYIVFKDLKYDLAVGGEKLNLNGSVDDFRVIKGKLAVSFEDGRKILAGKDISHCDWLENVEIINGKTLCPGPDRTIIHYGERKLGKSYDEAMKPFEYNDSIAFVAQKEGSWFIVNQGKRLTEKYSGIYHAFPYNDSVYFSGVRQGKTNVYRNDKKVTDFPIAFFANDPEGEEKPLITVMNPSGTLYKGRKPVKTADWIEDLAVTEEGLTYQYYKDGKTFLVTPDKNISEGYVHDFGYGDRGLAYLTEREHRHFLVYNDGKSMNFSDTTYIKFVNRTPYFRGVKNDHVLLMEGLDVHTNLSEGTLPGFMEEDRYEEEEEYETVEEENSTYIMIEGEKHGPFLPQNDTTLYPYLNDVTHRNGSVALVENMEEKEFLYYNGKRYGSYDFVYQYELLPDKILYTAVKDDRYAVKKITG